MKSKKVQGIIGKTLFIIIALLSSAVFCLQNRVSDFFSIVLFREMKNFYQSSLGNEVDFRDKINISPNILVKNYNFKKPRHSFVDKRAWITTALISSCQWKTFVPFCLQKKRPEKTFLTLITNYCKIVQENKLWYSKQQ